MGLGVQRGAPGGSGVTLITEVAEQTVHIQVVNDVKQGGAARVSRERETGLSNKTWLENGLVMRRDSGEVGIQAKIASCRHEDN